MKHIWHPLAEAEFDEALDYYVIHAGANIGRKFATAINHTLELLLEHPAIGKPMYRQARSIPLHGFPFDLVYRIKKTSHCAQVAPILKDCCRRQLKLQGGASCPPVV